MAEVCSCKHFSETMTPVTSRTHAHTPTELDLMYSKGSCGGRDCTNMQPSFWFRSKQQHRRLSSSFCYNIKYFQVQVSNRHGGGFCLERNLASHTYIIITAQQHTSRWHFLDLLLPRKKRVWTPLIPLSCTSWTTLPHPNLGYKPDYRLSPLQK